MLVFEKQEKDSKHMPSLGKMMILILTYKICRNLPSDQPHCSKCLGVLRTLVGDTKWTGAAHSLKKKSLLKWRTIVYTTHPEQVYHLLVQPLLSAAGCWNILFVLNVCAVLVRKQSRERSSMTSFSWVAGELLYPSEYLRGNLGKIWSLTWYHQHSQCTENSPSYLKTSAKCWMSTYVHEARGASHFGDIRKLRHSKLSQHGWKEYNLFAV